VGAGAGFSENDARAGVAAAWPLVNLAPAAENLPSRNRSKSKPTLVEMPMWTKPEYSEMRFGFEVTMYIANR
jgi:coenzyme PQQ precursor peptide PqqA